MKDVKLWQRYVFLSVISKNTESNFNDARTAQNAKTKLSMRAGRYIKPTQSKAS
jgi:hypothetical protein